MSVGIVHRQTFCESSNIQFYICGDDRDGGKPSPKVSRVEGQGCRKLHSVVAAKPMPLGNPGGLFHQQPRYFYWLIISGEVATEVCSRTVGIRAGNAAAPLPACDSGDK